MRRLLGAVVLVVVVTVGFLGGGLIQNRLPWGQPPGFSARIDTYLNTHVAETAEASPFPELRPRHYEGISADALFTTLEQAIARLPDWRVTVREPARRTVRAVVTSRIWRFRDDTEARIDPDGDRTGAVLSVRSASRVGKGDLGANTRHILDLYAQLDAMLPPPRTAAWKTPPARSTPLF